MKHIRATVILLDGSRVMLDAICHGRSELDAIVARAYPDHRACFTIVSRGA